ncbi:MAG: dipeptide epimerase [Bacteroidota bacterium]|nr:dipeptide epimerase [Bacteroidota bacterium]
MSDLKLSYYPYQLLFKFPFKIAHGVRDSTDVIFLRLECGDFIGWGEATLPPYLQESQRSVVDFLSGLDISIIKFPLDPAAVFAQLDNAYFGNMAAKAALDMALWNLKSAIENKSVGNLLGITSTKFPLNTYTVGVCGLDEMALKINDATENSFELFKVKLNGKDDEEMIRNFRNLCHKPFAVDVNQGWKSVEEATEKINWLKDQGCILVEQPLNKGAVEDMKLLKSISVLPLYADESCQRLGDIETLREGFHGVNIKLMKCGGISEAIKMIARAKQLELKVLIGCMSESSVGCTAAAHLSPLADYADLDGPYLISNNPFTGVLVDQGRISLAPLVATASLGS